MEDAMLDTLVQRAIEEGITTIYGYYYPTAKNGMVKEFYKTQGFQLVSEAQNGDTVWELNPQTYNKRNYIIEVEK